MPLNLITHFLSDDKHFCLMCFAPLKDNNLHTLLNKNIYLCDKCFNNLGPILKEEKINGIKGTFLFEYSPLMKEKIYTLKGCGDIELAKCFLNYFINDLRKKYKGYYLVCAPSNESMDTQRGFNHVKEIFKEMKLNYLDVLYKKVNYKQSDLNKEERLKVKNKLDIKDFSLIKNKKILFVDDTSTSGATLSASLELIKKGQPKKLNFLVVAKVINLYED